VGVDLDPEVEQQEDEAADPTQDMKERRVTWRPRQAQEGQGEKSVGKKVVEEDDIDRVSEENPYLRKKKR
jgi:hypothetical protein